MAKVITVNLPDKEQAILEAYCLQESRTQTEIIKEFIRGLKEKLDN